MTSTKGTKANLVRLLFLITFLIGCMAIGIDLILQEQAKTELITDESRTTISWLRANIVELGDSEVSEIFEKMQETLKSYDTFIQTPHVVTIDQPLVASDEFPAYNRANPQTSSMWKLSDRPATSINFGFSSFIVSQGFNPTPQEIAADKERYKNFMGSLISWFTNNVTTKDWSPSDYSKRMTGFFGAKELVEKRMPGLAIHWIYVASSKGTLALYPGNNQTLSDLNFNKRDWYTSIVYGKPQSENIASDPTFGLVPFYPDILIKGSPRTYWHKVNAGNVDYYICVDLELMPPGTQFQRDYIDSLFPQTHSITSGKRAIRALKIGAVFGFPVFILGALFVALARKSSARLGRWIISGNITPKVTETGDKIRVIFKALASQIESKSITKDTRKGASTARRTSFAAWIQMKVFQIKQEEEQLSEEAESVTTKDQVELRSLDKDWSTRGIEKWEIFRSQGQWVGHCRLCGQEIRYQNKQVAIGKATIRHHMGHRPDVDIDIDPRSHYAESNELRERVVWRAFDSENKILGDEYQLGVFPAARVPATLADLSFTKELVKKYRLLNEGRYETDNCVELSKEIFKDRMVKAVCKIGYFQRLIDARNESIEALCIGSSIERILVADTQERIDKFIDQHRDILLNLLARKNVQLYTVSLDNTEVESIEKYPELDFALAYDSDLIFLIVSNVSDHGKAGNIRGYLSWREVDTSFCDAIFKRLSGFRHPLTLDDIKL